MTLQEKLSEERRIGHAQGRAEGHAEGQMSTIFKLVSDGNLEVSIGARYLNCKWRPTTAELAELSGRDAASERPPFSIVE